MKMLGYKWTTEPDLLFPGLGELNLNKKIRGREDARILLQDIKLTRRTILAKVTDFYNPCGFWEPIKLQMKLAMLPLKGLEWDDKISDIEQDKWSEILTTFVE